MKIFRTDGGWKFMGEGVFNSQDKYGSNLFVSLGTKQDKVD